jgi:KDO2-lipid IV(A) lauroyltransferase
MSITSEKAVYWLIRAATYPFMWMPYSWIHWIGRRAGSALYHLLPRYRKRTLSNLAHAKDLALTSAELRCLAKRSFQNLAINCLEYSKLSKDADLSRVVACDNPQQADALYRQGQGIIFFCGHQANWEVLFLDGTKRMRGMAIGKSIHNKPLYHWILRMREKYGGKIVPPQNAVREGIRALRKGIFLGIVGDQGMPNSGYSSLFLGRQAWTSPAPALLAYKTRSPIIFASTRRVRGGYRIRYSDPIWPNLDEPLEKETVRMMDQALSLLQASIREAPGDWLWQHNRWKQQTPQFVYRKFRHDSIALILPQNPEALASLLPHLPTFRRIYELPFLALFVPESAKGAPLIPADETHYYTDLKETLLDDYRFKLLFDFADYPPIRRHYRKRSALLTLSLSDLKRLAAPRLSPENRDNLSEILWAALCRKKN